MVRNTNRLYGAAGLVVGGLCMVGIASGAPVAPPSDVQCTQCNCIYVKGWWLEFDGSYKAFCTPGTFNPVWTGTSIQSYDCPGDNTNGAAGAGANADRVGFRSGNNTCNKLVASRGNSLIRSTVSDPIGKEAGVTAATCLDAKGQPIPVPTP